MAEARERMTSASEHSHPAVVRSLRVRSTAGYRPPPPVTIDTNPGAEMPQDFDQLKLMENELQWYRDLPVTNIQVPLVFVNDPAACGQFCWPSQAKLVQPNVGLHALKVGHHANSAFLATESRYCELLTVLPTKEQSDKIVALIRLIHIELSRLNHEKELQWIQQRGEYVAGMVLVNTGQYEDSFLLRCE